MRRFLGYSCIFTIIAILFSVTAIDVGVIYALMGWAIVLMMTGLLILGIFLIS